jgi:hypothetical protein
VRFIAAVSEVETRNLGYSYHRDTTPNICGNGKCSGRKFTINFI